EIRAAIRTAQFVETKAQFVERKTIRWKILFPLLVLLAGSGVLMIPSVRNVLFQASRPPNMPASIQILVGDFQNKTDDARLGYVIRAGLTAFLEQSPRINLFSPESAQRTKIRIGAKPDSPIDEQLGRAVASSQQIPFLLTGELTGSNNRYVLTTKLVDVT